MTRPSIYEAAGGAPAIHALAAAHHARCLAHPLLEHPFSHGVESYSPADARVPPALPSPVWTWNGLALR